MRGKGHEPPLTVLVEDEFPGITTSSSGLSAVKWR